jgi:hypothetical protein
MAHTFTQEFTEKTRKLGFRTATIMADLLCISEDAAYRRLRNPQSLRADEMILLAKEFNIDLNKFSHADNNWLSGQLKTLNFETYTSDDFYTELESRLDHCIHQNHSHIMYGAKEVPMFYYMWFPALAQFKNFIWNREFLKQPELNRTKFQAKPNEFKWMKLAEKYLKIASHEIWGYETLYSTLYQIYHYKESGMFADDRTFLNVLKEYDQLINLVYRQAELGRKLNPYVDEYLGARYKLFFTPMITTDNSIIFHTLKDKIAVICSQMSGVVFSEAPHWVYSTENWLETCKENGTLISKTGQSARNKFLIQDYGSKKQMLGLF